jgi:hypothetical protein
MMVAFDAEGAKAQRNHTNQSLLLSCGLGDRPGGRVGNVEGLTPGRAGGTELTAVQITNCSRNPFELTATDRSFETAATPLTCPALIQPTSSQPRGATE